MTTIIDLPVFDDYDGFRSEDYRNFVQTRRLTHFMKGHDGFIAGGCFKNLFLGEDVRDVDIFFRSETDWNNAIKTFERDSDYSFHYETERAIGYKHNPSGIVVECINVFFGEPEQILNTFDFTVAKAALVRADEGRDFNFIYHGDFFKHLLLRRLVVGPLMYNPINTFERSLKYTKYGFGLCRESKINLLSAIQLHQGLDPSNLSSSIYNGLD